MRRAIKREHTYTNRETKELVDDGSHLWFECPGCKHNHSVVVRQSTRNTYPVWQWNGSEESPTINPSILVTWGRDEKNEVCHSYVREGKIQFLDDCFHELKGQTVDLPILTDEE